jgi:hypothetical protein
MTETTIGTKILEKKKLLLLISVVLMTSTLQMSSMKFEFIFIIKIVKLGS